jgi:hypothetical protein
MGKRRGAYRVLMGKLEGRRRSLGRLKRRWEENIKMDVQEGEWTGSVWVRTGTGGGLL